MSGKASVEAPSNIAFIKYWGTRDRERTLPYNPSISMTLSRCVSRCTVEHRPDGVGHEVLLRDGGDDRFLPAGEAFASGVKRHLDRLRHWAGAEGSFAVATENSFPTGAGMASSASGFAALTLATLGALGRRLGIEEVSALARLSGSGSAARSVLGGYVEWPSERSVREGAAVELAPAGHWELCDVVAVVDSSPKEVSSRQGHRRAPSSPYWERRLERLPARLEEVRRAIAERDLERLGKVMEDEAVDMHLVAMSSRPPILYWTAGTFAVLELARRLRQRGVGAWATIDAGPNVHLICASDDAATVSEELEACDEVESVIFDRVGAGPRPLERHLV